MPRNLTQELKLLPPFDPPADGWSAVRIRVEQGSRASRSKPHYLALAAAAILFIAAGLFVLLQGRWSHTPMLQPSVTPRPAALARPSQIQQLMQRSQQLEALLHTLPSRPAVERVGTSATIAELQNSIQWVDLRLTDAAPPADSGGEERLWNTRVALLSSLVDVRYAEAIRGGEVQAIDTGVI